MERARQAPRRRSGPAPSTTPATSGRDRRHAGQRLLPLLDLRTARPAGPGSTPKTPFGRGRGEIPQRRRRGRSAGSASTRRGQHGHPRRQPLDQTPARSSPRRPSAGRRASGWQQVNFSSPVSIQPNTTYVAATSPRTGITPPQEFAFDHPPATGPNNLDAPPLHVLPDNGNGNGLYQYTDQPRLPTGHLPVGELLGGRRVQRAGTRPGAGPGDERERDRGRHCRQRSTGRRRPAAASRPATDHALCRRTAQTPTTVSAPASSKTITGLTGGTTYTFKVTAIN